MVLEVRFIVVVGSDLFLIGGFVLRRRFRVFVFSSSDEEPEDVRQSGTGAIFNRRIVFRLRLFVVDVILFELSLIRLRHPFQRF